MSIANFCLYENLVLAALISAGALSRALLPVLMRLLPLAREQGRPSGAGQPIGPRAVAAVVLGVLLLTAGAAWAIGGPALRLIGGMTGDVLGMAQQTSEVLVLLAVVAPCLNDPVNYPGSGATSRSMLRGCLAPRSARFDP